MPTLTIRALAFLLLAFLAPLISATAQPFQGIPRVDGFELLDVMGVSADGKVVFGTAWNWDAPGGSRAFRWEDGDFTLLNPLSGDVDAEAYAASADGAVIVGKSCGSGTLMDTCRGVKWTGSSAAMLPFMGGNVDDPDFHGAHAVSADGAIIAGYLNQDGDDGPVRWSGGAPSWAQPANFDSFFLQPHAMSDDGRVIAAANYILSSQRVGYYTDELYRIVDQSPIPLSLPSDVLGGSVIGISGDGSVIVGAVRRGSNDFPVQWGPDGYKELPLPDVAISGEAIDATLDGSIVLGRYLTSDFRQGTVVWRDGVYSDLQTELDDAGVDLNGSEVGPPAGISADGSVVVTDDWGNSDFAALLIRIPLRLVVNDVGDERDADVGDGKCDADLNEEGLQCTFRAALQEADALPEKEVIVAFDIPAGEIRDGVYQIEITSPLDPVTRALSIDGTTQPGYQEGTQLVVIMRSPSLQPAPNYGLRLHTNGSVVRGLTLLNHSHAGILISGKNNRIEENFFEANTVGVHIQSGSQNVIGVCPEEDEEAEGVVTGNAFIENRTGILLSDGAHDNDLECNAVTIHPFPDRRSDAMETGIEVRDSWNNRIVSNPIDAQLRFGILIQGEEASENQLVGNRLGESVANGWGIVVNGGSANQVGGDDAPNIVFQSGLGGVLVLSDIPTVLANQNVLHNLWIGTNEDGEVEEGNSRGFVGIAIGEGAVDTEIGKITPDGDYSIIIGNQQDRSIALFTPLAKGTRINSALIGFGKEVINGGGFQQSFSAGKGIEILGAVGTQLGSWTSDFESRPSVRMGRHNDVHIEVSGETTHRITVNGVVETTEFEPVATGTIIRGVRFRFSELNCRGSFRACDVNTTGIRILQDANVEIGPQIDMQTPGTGIALENSEDVRILGANLTEVSGGVGSGSFGLHIYGGRNVQVGAPGYVNLFGVETSLGNRIVSYRIGAALRGQYYDPVSYADGTKIQANIFDSGARIGAIGIRLEENTRNTQIGGSGEGEGNEFRELGTGVLLDSGAKSKQKLPPSNTTISGNLFEDSNASTGEGGTGIEVVSAADTHIGGALSGGNVIRNLKRAIVLNRPLDDRSGTVVVGNSIYGNASNGIIGWAGTSDFLNDPLRLPHPTVLGTVTDGVNVTALGKVIGHPDRALRIDFYSSDACRSVDEGRTFLLSQSTGTGALGIASFEAQVPIAVGQGLTVTATDLDALRTSEFSLCFTHEGLRGTVEHLLDATSAVFTRAAEGLLARFASAGKTAETRKLYVTQYDQVPLADRFSGQSAVSASGEEILPASIVGRYWRVETDGSADAAKFDLCLDASALSPEQANEVVVVQRAAHSGGLWVPTETRLETHEGTRFACANGLAPTGDFALGSGNRATIATSGLLAPANHAAEVSAPARFEWNAADGAATYRIQVALDPGFAAIVIDTSGLAATSFVADSLVDGSPHYWRVRGANAAGDIGPWSSPFRFTAIVIPVAAEDAEELPERIALHQNYPNPFNPQTRIPFEIDHTAHVRLAVYDLLGREVVRLVDDVRPAGRHEVTFDGTRLPTGVYIYRLEAGAVSRSGRMVLLK